MEGSMHRSGESRGRERGLDIEREPDSALAPITSRAWNVMTELVGSRTTLPEISRSRCSALRIVVALMSELR